jgi:hypothetical protein
MSDCWGIANPSTGMSVNKRVISSEKNAVLRNILKFIAIVVFKVKVAAKVVKSFQFGNPLFSFLCKDLQKAISAM